MDKMQDDRELILEFIKKQMIIILGYSDYPAHYHAARKIVTSEQYKLLLKRVFGL